MWMNLPQSIEMMAYGLESICSTIFRKEEVKIVICDNSELRSFLYEV